MMKMTRTRPADLAGLFAVATGAAWLLVSVFYGSLPPVSVFAGASLYPIAVIEVIIAIVIRLRVANREVGDGPGRLHPITAARAVTLAKVSALVGSASAGVWLGFALWVLPQSATVRAAGTDRPGVIVGLLGGVVLVAAALWLEHCCETPEDPPDEPAH